MSEYETTVVDEAPAAPVAGAVAGVIGVSLVFWLVAILLGAGAAIGYRAPLDAEPPPRQADAGAA